MTEGQIYIRFKGRTLGPFTRERVQDLARRGQVTRLHELSSDGMSWVKFDEFGDLFPASQQAEPAPASAAAARQSPPMATARGPANAASSGEQPIARSGTAPDDATQWYTHHDGNSQGPLTTQRLSSLAREGQLSADTLLWRSGFDDWKSAANVLPELFTNANSDGRSTVPFAGVGVQATVSVGRTGMPSDIHHELGRQRFWVIASASLLLLLSVMNAISSVVYMIVGADSGDSGSEPAGVKVLSGLLVLSVSVLFIIAGTLLMRYGIALKDIANQRDEKKMARAIAASSVFWKFCGIVSCVLFLLIVLSVCVAFAMAAGFGAGVA